MVLLFYYKGMLEKGRMQRTHKFSAFSLLPKNPVECSACVVSGKRVIERKIDFSEMRLFLENHSLAFHEIWHKNTLGNK